MTALMAGVLTGTALAQSTQVEDTKFSVKRGFYSAAFDTQITTNTFAATIRYTLDGSDPRTSTNTWQGFSPVVVRIDPISTNFSLRDLTPAVTLRAYAFKAGMTATNVDTHTYIFVDRVLTQQRPPGYPVKVNGSNLLYAMDPNVVNATAYKARIRGDMLSIPSMSVVMKKEDIFGTGGLMEAKSSTIERAASIELIYPDGRTGFQEDCGIKPHSHVVHKRSLRVYFRGSYGAKWLKYPLFRDAVGVGDTAAQKFDVLVLRAGNNDILTSILENRNGNSTYVSDQLARHSQILMSGYGSRGIFVHLYLNGLYWGLYNPVERPDEAFLSSYFGGQKDDWYASNHSGTVHGSPTHYAGLLTNLGNWSLVQQRLDTDGYADYILYWFYCGGGDWPGKNWYAGNRTKPTDKVRFLVWDCEACWISLNKADQTYVWDYSNDGAWIHPDILTRPQDPAKIWQAVDDQADFRMTFADRVYKHCFNDGVLTDANTQARWDAMLAEIDKAIVGESARWGQRKGGGGLWTRDGNWVPYSAKVRKMMAGNAQAMVKALRDTKLPQAHPKYYPDTDPPLFLSGSSKITVTDMVVPPSFSLKIQRDGTAGTIYYTIDGSDPRGPGGKVQGLNGGTGKTLTISTNTVVRARTLNSSEWSALHEISLTVAGKPIQLQIHEFLAQNTTGIRDEAGEREDWIELLNTGATAIDISGYFLTDELTTPKKWVFPLGTIIPAGGTLLVWADNEFVEGPLHAAFKLSSGGDAIAVLDKGSNVVDSVTFGTQRENVSTGRLFGYGLWVSLESPSPGQANMPQPSGHLSYEGLNASVSQIRLRGNGHAGAASQVWYDISGAPRQTAGLVAASIGPWNTRLGSLGNLLVNPLAMALLPIGTDLIGEARLSAPVPNIPSLKRQLIFVQAIVLNGNGGGLSNGVMTRMWH